jgi:translation initiation factor IF-2
MAKVRVYELARELNMDSKELVEKLLAGGLSIKNYMSTLDEEAVQRAKDIVAGVISEVVEEKRVTSGVIRRRRKQVRVEAPVEEAKEEETAVAETPEKPSEALAAEEAEEAAPEEAVQEVEPVEVSSEEGVAEVEPEKKPAGAVPEEAAKIPPLREEEIEGKIAKTKKAKKKREEAAKIIKRPEEGPLKDVLAKQTARKAPPPPEQEVVAGLEEVPEKVEVPPEKEKQERKKRAKKGAEVEEKAPKRSVRRRKREIYEKADLYDGRTLRPKGKKAGKKGKEEAKKVKHTEITVPKAIKRRIKIPEAVTVSELARAMGVKAAEVIKRLMAFGVVSNINQPIDFESANVVADDFGYELELDTFEEERLIADSEDRPEDLRDRPPVVTIMGHVDHGKTSLLDYIRKSNIIGSESGGITQHIGAYYVATEGGDIVFLDTPGHEAFTAMRARGAEVTDLIILVVAADDGAMPQTREAINHARAAGIPIVVAVNKIDKPQADPEKVRRELADFELTPEEWGGETLFGNISAKTGEGVVDLLGLVLLQAEMLELKGNPNKPARGAIIEAKLDKSKGPVSTVLIKNGTLRTGDYFVCGEHHGRIRAMTDHRGKRMDSAGPSMPVEIYGISGVPMAGDEFVVVSDEKTGRQISEYRHSRTRQKEVRSRSLVSLDDLYERIKEGEVKELNIVIKADVQGSIEALSDSLTKQSTEEVKVKIIHSATGAITESDVMLASASGAIIIGFNVRANQRVVEIAEKESVDIRYYDVIYNVIKDIRLAMAGLLEPVYTEDVIGHADIKQVFRIPKIGTVAGCQVTDGVVERNANVRLLRDEIVVFDGKISSLKRFKEDAREVASGYECGIGLENFQDIKPGDVVEVYKVQEVEAEL